MTEMKRMTEAYKKTLTALHDMKAGGMRWRLHYEGVFVNVEQDDGSEGKPWWTPIGALYDPMLPQPIHQALLKGHTVTVNVIMELDSPEV